MDNLTKKREGAIPPSPLPPVPMPIFNKLFLGVVSHLKDSYPPQDVLYSLLHGLRLIRDFD